MYSLNAPVPPPVARLALDLADELPGARARGRGEHSILVKRLGVGADARGDHLVASVRETLAGSVPVEARVAGVDCFAEPVTGTGPVVYLAVESPGLVALHRRLCEIFDPVAHLEGDSYVPHVTIARGGDPEAARALAGRQTDPIDFAVEELVVRDAHRELDAARFSLPL